MPPQPVLPIRKLPQASYAYASKNRQNGNHNYRKLTKPIPWITALSNSMKRWAMPCRATQDGGVMVESSDKMWFTGEGMANHFSILALRIPWRVWQGKNIWHWKMNSSGQYMPNMLLEKSGEIAPGIMKRLRQSINSAQLWMWLVMEVKSDAVENNIV